MTQKQYTIDATGKSIGRVASQAAGILMGKNRVDFRRNVAPDVSVEITNASRAAVSEKARAQKLYTRYSGYPGGLKHEPLSRVISRKG